MQKREQHLLHARQRIGVSSDVAARLSAHNAGQDPSTSPWKPWLVDVCVELRSEQIALRFEKYLKSGSGHAFAKAGSNHVGARQYLGRQWQDRLNAVIDGRFFLGGHRPPRLPIAVQKGVLMVEVFDVFVG